ncbi:hypothetical protein V1522DRAFT_414146 [Lipomyces starkeyi]
MENDVVPAGRSFRVLVIIETCVCLQGSFRWTPAFFRLDKSVLQDDCKLKYNLLIYCADNKFDSHFKNEMKVSGGPMIFIFLATH